MADCACCAMIRGRARRDAEYRWTGLNGYPIAICGGCLVEWWRNAGDDEDMAPRQLVVLTDA